MEPALRQSRQRVNKALLAIRAQNDLEGRVHLLAEVYKRLLEGPVRQYGWALLCLQSGVWHPPPMITSLYEPLIAAKGWLAEIAISTIMPEMRNSEAHETLVWDGFNQTFLVEGEIQISIARILHAVTTADSFARGFEVAHMYNRALDVAPTILLPNGIEDGRLPAWRRAEAFFGTYGFRVLRAQFNANTAVVRVDRLDARDINPCFQALSALGARCRGFNILKFTAVSRLRQLFVYLGQLLI